MMRFEKLSEQWVRRCPRIQRLNRAASRVELLKCVTRRHAAPNTSRQLTFSSSWRIRYFYVAKMGIP